VGGTTGAGGATSTVAPTRVNITDNITTPTVWTADHVYVIANDISVVSTLLTINAGTVVKFASQADLYVDTGSQLKVNGSAGAHVVFTSLKDDGVGGDTDGAAMTPASGDWEGLWVDGNSSSFDYAEIRYATTALALTASSQSVAHTVFTNNDVALDADGVDNAGSTLIASNTFYANNTPIMIQGDIAVDSTNVFHDPSNVNTKNTLQAIAVNSDIANTVTWSNTEVAYAIPQTSSGFGVASNKTLTLASGVAVKFAAGVTFTVSTGATLASDSTNIFTSYKDDAVKGDSNGDGATTVVAADYWEGIYVSGTSSWLTGANVKFATTH
jgi:hypothetical protein